MNRRSRYQQQQLARSNARPAVAKVAQRKGLPLSPAALVVGGLLVLVLLIIARSGSGAF